MESVVLLPSWPILDHIGTILLYLGATIVVVASAVLFYHWKRYAYNATIIPMAGLYLFGLVVIGLTAWRIAGQITL